MIDERERDEVLEEIIQAEADLKRLRSASPINDTHAATIRQQIEANERHLQRLLELA